MLQEDSFCSVCRSPVDGGIKSQILIVAYKLRLSFHLFSCFCCISSQASLCSTPTWIFLAWGWGYHAASCFSHTPSTANIYFFFHNLGKCHSLRDNILGYHASFSISFVFISYLKDGISSLQCLSACYR